MMKNMSRMSSRRQPVEGFIKLHARVLHPHRTILHDCIPTAELYRKYP